MSDRLHRRDFIRWGGSLAAGLGLPPLLSGCAGGSDDSASDTGSTTLHFVLSPDGSTGYGEDYRLHVGGRHHVLREHDAASRRAAGVTDDTVSHFAEAVALPADRPLHLYVTQRSDRAGLIRAAHGADARHALVLSALHVPQPRASAAAARPGGRRGALAGGDVSVSALATYGPADVAAAILFHHTNLTTFDADQAARVMDHIQQAVGLSDFEAAIKSAGRYGWYTMAPVLADDGTPVQHADGSAVVQYLLVDSVVAAAQRPLASALNAVQNDPQFKGSFHSTDVQPASSGPSRAALSTSGAGRRRALDTITANGLTYTLSADGRQGGLDVAIDSVSGQQVTLSFSSRYLRHLSVFVEYLDADGNPVDAGALPTGATVLGDETLARLETPSRRFLTMLPPPGLFMSGPLLPSGGTATFTLPPQASRVRVLAGGLGNGGERNAAVEEIGVALTATFNVGLPSLLLATSAAMHSEISLASVYRANVMTTVIDKFFALVWSQGQHTAAGILTSSAVFLANIMMSKALQAVLTLIIEEEAESATLDAIPFIGWALNAVAITTTAAQLAQTSAEVMASPWIIENVLTVTHRVVVSIDKPADDFEFPATATHFEVALSFSHAAPVVQRVELPGITASSPQVVVFDNVPAGGLVDAAVTFYSCSDWVCGHASLAGIRNVDDAGQGQLTLSMVLVENLVPLSSATRYAHKQRLVAGAGRLAWAAGAAPTATRNSLSAQLSAGSLASLSAVTLNQTLGRLSYTWQGYSGPVAQCHSSAAGVLGYAYRTVGLTADPGDGVKFSGCFGGQPTLVDNALFTSATGAGGNLMVQPAGDLGFTVSRFALDATPGYASEGVLGVFPLPPDEIRRFSNGIVIGISRSMQKIMRLRLADAPVDAASAPVATLLGGPALSAAAVASNPALLLSPVSLAVGPRDELILLEVDPTLPGAAGTLRAFNSAGVPIGYFGSAKAHALALQPSDQPITYHALQIEARGYLYVLSHEGDGSGVQQYRLDLYDPAGTFLATSRGLAAERFALDVWRNVYTLNYESFIGPAGDTEPSVSQWIPSTPGDASLCSTSSKAA